MTLFFDLIQVAINRREKLSSSPSVQQWETLYQMTKEQTLQGITFSALKKLPIEQLPPAELIGKWYFDAISIEQKNKEINIALSDLASILNTNNICYAIVKGQVCGLAYNELALSRCPGDIDFYVVPEDYQRAKSIIEQELQVHIITDEAADKHDSFEYKGVSFEMHYRLETFGTHKHQICFDNLMQRATISAETVDIVGTKIKVLNREEHILMVFKHLFNHLLIEGVGLRQFIDLMMLLENYDPLNDATIRTQMQSIGYEKAFRAVCAVLVHYFGMSPKKCPYSLRSIDFHWAQQLINVPLSRGNFGQYHRDYTHTGWRKSLETLLIAMQHCLNFWPLAPRDITGLLGVRTRITLKKYYTK